MPETSGYTVTEIAGAVKAAEMLAVHPSWLPLIVGVLQREHTASLRAAITTAVQENAERLVARKVPDAGP